MSLPADESGEYAPEGPPSRPRPRIKVLAVTGATVLGLLLWLVAGFGPEPVPELRPSQETVRVLVHSHAQQLALRASEGLRLVSDSGEHAPRDLGRSVELSAGPSGIRLRIGDAEPLEVEAPSLRIEWSGEAEAHLDGAAKAQRWPGALAVERGEEGLRVIPHVELERYLTGVLAREMSPSFSPDALAAQAVAARSYVLESMQRLSSRSYDVFGDQRSQVFRGVDEHPRILRAVAATQGIVLKQNGSVLRAYYSSTCGGRTRDGHERMRDVPAGTMPSVECLGCAISEKTYRWTRRIPPEDWEKLGLSAPPSSVQILEKSPRGDWQRLRLVAPIGEPVELSGEQLRRQLGLRSTWLEDLTEEGEDRVIHGRGFGHGVGLCQWGAEGYARQGWSWQRILRHYYPGAEITSS